MPARADWNVASASLQSRPIRPLVDREQEVACTNRRAILEVDLVEVARHPRANVDLIDGLEATNEVVPLIDLFHDRPRNRYGRRPRAGSLGQSTAGFAKRSDQQEQWRNAAQ